MAHRARVAWPGRLVATGVTLVTATLIAGEVSASVAVLNKVADTTPARLQGLEAVVSLDGNLVEVHLLPRIDADQDEVALVLALPTAAEVRPASLQLFDELRRGTLPKFEVTVVEGPCDSPFDAPPGPQTPGTAEATRASRWPFDVTSLSDPIEALAYLENKGFDVAPLTSLVPPQTGAVVMLEYDILGTTENRIFHPISIRFAGAHPYLPLPLATASATDTMEIGIVVLGDGRATVDGAPMLTVNPLRIDWTHRGLDYPERLAQAVNVPFADGRAFAFESFRAVTDLGLNVSVDDRWDASAYATLEWFHVVAVLEEQGGMECSSGGPCVFLHPSIEGLLERHLHVPTTVDRHSLYRCPECYADSDVVIAWDAEGFANAFAEHVIGAAERARAVVERSQDATRLGTVIARDDLDFDLEFHFLSAGDHTWSEPAELANRCGGDPVITLPDGRSIVLPDGAWPDFEDMPVVEVVSAYAPPDEERTLLDERDTIEALLLAHNASLDWPPTAGCRTTGAGRTPYLAMFILLALVARRRW